MRRPIGEYLVQLGVLTEAEVKRVLAHAKCASIRLDEAAIQLKLISPQQLKMVFGPNYRVDFCNLDSLKLPDPTRSMLGINVLIKLGVLPLGFVADIEEEDGKDVFEIGLINPSREDAVAVMRAVACIRFGKEKFEKMLKMHL